jgi:hypothetical protein
VGSLDIDKSAVKSGINWYSIYHPDAVRLMRFANLLGRKGLATGGPDPDLNNCRFLMDPARLWSMPMWHPAPSLTNLSALMSCAVTAVRGDYPSPWTWTTFDPTCGPTNNRVACLHRSKKHINATLSYRSSP